MRTHFGYNLKATEMQAAIGRAQLEKLPVVTEKRMLHFKRLKNALEGTGDRIMRDSFWVGVYPGTTDEKIDYMERVIKEAIY